MRDIQGNKKNENTTPPAFDSEDFRDLETDVKSEILLFPFQPSGLLSVTNTLMIKILIILVLYQYYTSIILV